MAVKSLKPVEVDVKQNLDALFAFEQKIAKETPALLQVATKEKFLQFLTGEENSSTWLCKDDKGKFVAYVTLIDKPREQEIEVLAIRVDPQLQRSGYGREMMKFAEMKAKEMGRKKVMLASSPKNLKAIAFYKSIGYQIIKEVGNYYGDGTSRYILEKSLNHQ